MSIFWLYFLNVLAKINIDCLHNQEYRACYSYWALIDNADLQIIIAPHYFLPVLDNLEESFPDVDFNMTCSMVSANKTLLVLHAIADSLLSRINNHCPTVAITKFLTGDYIAKDIHLLILVT